MKHVPKIFRITTLIFIGSTYQSNVAVNLSPVGIISESGGAFNPNFAVKNLINGSVTSSIISGVTEFNTCKASASSATDSGIPWAAADRDSDATIIFDLRDQYNVTAMAILNSPPGSYPGPGQGTNLLKGQRGSRGFTSLESTGFQSVIESGLTPIRCGSPGISRLVPLCHRELQ